VPSATFDPFDVVMPRVAPVIADYAAHLDRMTARFLEEAGASGMADPAGEVLQSARELLVALAAVMRVRGPSWAEWHLLDEAYRHIAGGDPLPSA
jgi:hypothetical protein